MPCSKHFPTVKVLLILALTTGLSACEARDERRQSRESRRQYEVVMAGKLRQLDRSIATLPYAGADSAYANRVDALRQRHRSLQSRLGDMSAASDQDWLSWKDSLEVGYRDLRDEYGLLERSDATTSVQPVPDTLGVSGGTSN